MVIVIIKKKKLLSRYDQTILLVIYGILRHNYIEKDLKFLFKPSE